MKKTSLLILSAFSLLFADGASAQPIEVTSNPADLIIAKSMDLKPDKLGFVLSEEVQLPAFEKGAYYRPFSGGVARGNRVEAVAFNSIKELEGYKPSKTRNKHDSVQEGQFMLLKINEEKYLALLPMTSGQIYSQFFIEDGKLILKAGNFGTDEVKGDLPLLIWAYGDSPYAATRSVWKQVIDSGYVAADWRSKKEFPEPYSYLGWCSWEHYKTNISEKIITDAVHALEKTAAPIRWVIVDDGYFNEENDKLINFTPDQKKFPNGWKPVTALKSPEKIKWMGIWRNTIGYMAGISLQNTMNDLSGLLVKRVAEEAALSGGVPEDSNQNKKKKPSGQPAKRGSGDALLPNGTPEAAKAFYEKMARDARDSGFDFTKVDFQTRAFDNYKGLGNAVSAMRANNEALEESCLKNGLPLLNCIAQPNVNSLQTRYSALSRSSPDYNQSDKDKNKCNVYQSFANHLWMGQTVWGDLDMFHTHDKRDVEPMALARAIAGGPVYISDEPGKIVPDVLIPFAFSDGKLLRAQAPATLLPESFFIHPFRDGKVFRVIAPLEDRVAAIGLFNFTEGGQSLKGTITSKDYPFAGELLQPMEGSWSVPEEGLLIYDRASKKVASLSETFTADVANFGAKLFLLYPKTKGWAVIGRVDKYLPAAAVKMKSTSEKKIVFTMRESGPLAIWSANGAPKLEGATFERIGEDLYEADLPIKAGPVELTVTR